MICWLLFDRRETAMRKDFEKKLRMNLKPTVTAVAAAVLVLMSSSAGAAEDGWDGAVDLREIQQKVDEAIESGNGTLQKGLIGEETNSDTSRNNNNLIFPIYWNNEGKITSESSNGNYKNTIDKKVLLTGDLSVTYDLNEGKNVVATALNFFQPSQITNGAYYGLHEFVFDGNVDITIKDAEIHVSQMQAHGKDNPGLLLTNKKKIVRFQKRANLLVGYQAIIEDDAAKQDHLLVLSGIYNAFGAVQKWTDAQNVQTLFGGLNNAGAGEFKQADYEAMLNSKGGSMGTTVFEDGLNLVMVNSQRSTATTAKNRAAYGIFINEGGTVKLNGYSNVILIGSQGSTQLAAVNMSARAGILDVLKQGRFEFTAGGGTVNRIWSFSSDLIEDAQLSPFGQDEEDAQAHDLHLRDAIQSFHGSEAYVSDTASSSLDIRGDILAGVKNESGSIWEDHNSGQGDMTGIVNHASASITLAHPASRLFGNVYERHRLGLGEVAAFPAYGQSGQYSFHGQYYFNGWRDWMIIREEASLGGRVDLALENGATWYPIICEIDQKGEVTSKVPHGWNGWDYSAVTTFTDADTYNKTPNRSDQYNLYWVDKSGEKQVLNAAGSEDGTILNDYDLVKTDSNGKTNGKKENNTEVTITGDIPYVDRTGATLNEAQVDNGIFRLTLNGGRVDTRFMRLDFSDIVNVRSAADLDALTLSAVNEENGSGIRKLRIQELDGTGGTFSIYATDKANHDVIIIDESASGSVEKPVVNNLSIWNDIEDQTLGIDDKDPTTFVHVARAGRDVSFSEHFIKKTKGSAWATQYTVKKDEGSVWTNAQNASLEAAGGSAFPEGVILSHETQDNWFITDWKRTGNPEYEETAVNAFSMPYLYATQMERLQKRMGEARYAVGDDDGAWVRLHHGRTDRKYFEDKNTMVQVGWDRRSRHDGADGIHGIAFDYLHSDTDYTDALNGTSELDRYRLTLYSTWFGEKGWYADLVGRAAWHDTDLKGVNRDGDAFDTGFDMWGAAASLETGWKLASEEKWYVEPQVQLQYTYLGSSDYRTDNEVEIRNSHVESLIGRAGLRLGRDLDRPGETGTQKMNLYFRADVLHEFMGDQLFTMKGHHDLTPVRYRFKGDDTWYDMGAGFTYRAADDYTFFVDVERPLGSDIGNSWELNAGFRLLF